MGQNKVPVKSPPKYPVDNIEEKPLGTDGTDGTEGLLGTRFCPTPLSARALSRAAAKPASRKRRSKMNGANPTPEEAEKVRRSGLPEREIEL